MSFKIYQIHAFGGQWEDAYDYIVSSHLRPERAEEVMQELIEEQASYGDCRDCPAIFYGCDSEEALKYCSKYEPFDETKHVWDEIDDERCVNYDWNYGEPSQFRIEEVEVEE